LETAAVSATFAFEEAKKQARSDVEQYLRKMDPYDFQDLVGSLLKAMGYHVDWVSPPGKDGGFDVLALVDPLGTRPPRIKVQVKRYGTQSINVDLVRSFIGVLEEGEVGLFVTTSDFTKDAQEAARHNRKRVTLVDLERFIDHWVEHLDRLDEEARRRFPLQPIYYVVPVT
jgi:restriction system protein